jgi:hypothetical protein
MNPHLLRQLWSLIEGPHSHWIVSLDDNSLVQWLIEQVSGEQSLDSSETNDLNRYIRTRIPLIRDISGDY